MRKQESLTLHDLVASDINNFLQSRKANSSQVWLFGKGQVPNSKTSELFVNERQFQVELAMYLCNTKHYGNVCVEYPWTVQGIEKALGRQLSSKEFPWRYTNILNSPQAKTSKISLYTDIVVEKDDKLFLIELKYHTTDQQATNVSMYSYWKDVRRIEVIKKAYANKKKYPYKVEGGVAVLVTDTDAFWTPPQSNYKYAAFSTGNKTVGRSITWNANTSHAIVQKQPNFNLDSIYTCDWNNTSVGTFRYIVITI